MTLLDKLYAAETRDQFRAATHAATKEELEAAYKEADAEALRGWIQARLFYLASINGPVLP